MKGAVKHSSNKNRGCDWEIQISESPFPSDRDCFWEQNQLQLSSISLHDQEQVKGNKPPIIHLLTLKESHRAGTITQFSAAANR